MPLEEAFTKMADYQFGFPRTPLETIARATTQAAKDPVTRAVMADRLVTLLDIKFMPETRLFALRELAKVASSKQIPALAQLLDSEKLSPQAASLLAHLNDPAADAAIREALPSMGSLPRFVAITALGERRDERAMDLLRQMVCDCDPETAQVVLPTLARIGTPEAVKLIHDKLEIEDEDVRLTAQDSYLLVADELLAQGDAKRAAEMYLEVHELKTAVPGAKMAALRGLLLADPAKGKALAITVVKSDDRALRANAEQLLRTLEKR